MGWTEFWDNITTPGVVKEVCRELGESCDDLRKEIVQIMNEEGKAVVEEIPGALEEVVEIFTTGSLDPVNESVPEPRRGSVLYCRMRGIIARSGIYLGEERIAFLDEFGIVEAEEPLCFVMDVNTFKPPHSIFVSCEGSTPVGLDEIADRAQALVEAPAPDDITNAHQFTVGCLTGDFHNNSDSLDDVKRITQEQLRGNTWRRWNLGDTLDI